MTANTPAQPRPVHPTAQEARQRLEHARHTTDTQLRALTQHNHHDPHLSSAQQTALEYTLKQIDAAHTRLENGTYGICQGCHHPIPEERLEILPYTPHCVTCHTTT